MNTDNTHGNDYLQDETSPEWLYKHLSYATYSNYPYNRTKRGEGMEVVEKVICGYWKPRYLINHNTHRAFEFMDSCERLVTVSLDDIAWDKMNGLPETALSCARNLSFHFPSFIRNYANGVAEVTWQLNPDGMYYMDSDGFGMTDDVEISIYGFIDTEGKVVVKFQPAAGNDARNALRRQAEDAVKL